MTDENKIKYKCNPALKTFEELENLDAKPCKIYVTDNGISSIIGDEVISYGMYSTNPFSDGGTKYTRDDIYQSVAKERDALQALCEQMAGAILKVKDQCEDGDGFDESAAIGMDDAITAWEKHKEGSK